MRVSRLLLGLLAMWPTMEAWASRAAVVELVAACGACHDRTDPLADKLTPNLTGQKKSYLRAQLRAFRDGGRSHDIMNAIAFQLSDLDIDALSDYWSDRARDTVPIASAWRASPVVVPARFPRDFHVYLTVPNPADKTLRKFYANAAALHAAKAGQPLPLESTVVVVTSSATLDPTSGEWIEREAQAFAVMTSIERAGDAVPTLLRNGNWRYGIFDGQRKLQKNLDESQCLACHKPRAAHSFLFTDADLAKANPHR